MLGVGSGEFFLILIVAVLVLGPEHLPRIMRTVQKVMSDFRRIKTDFQRAVNLDMLEKDDFKSTTKKSVAKRKRKPIVPSDKKEESKKTAPKKKLKKKIKPPSAPVDEQEQIIVRLDDEISIPEKKEAVNKRGVKGNSQKANLDQQPSLTLKNKNENISSEKTAEASKNLFAEESEKEIQDSKNMLVDNELPQQQKGKQEKTARPKENINTEKRAAQKAESEQSSDTADKKRDLDE